MDINIWNRKVYLDDWYDNKLIQIYPNPSKIEPGRKLLHRWMPATKEEIDPLLFQIFEFVLARNKYKKWARDKSIFYPELPNLFTFFQDQAWRDKIPNHETPSEIHPIAVKSCNCGKESTVQRDSRWYCAWCYSKTYCLEGPTGISALRAACKVNRFGIRAGEAPEQYLARCRAIIHGGKTDFMGKLKESFAKLDYFPPPPEDEFSKL